jgi:hypothetical protein
MWSLLGGGNRGLRGGGIRVYNQFEELYFSSDHFPEVCFACMARKTSQDHNEYAARFEVLFP